jgi:hypothetical protein
VSGADGVIVPLYVGCNFKGTASFVLKEALSLDVISQNIVT